MERKRRRRRRRRRKRNRGRGEESSFSFLQEHIHATRWYNEKITRKEISKAMRICVAGKAAGMDRIKNEFIKHGGDAMVYALECLFNLIWEQEVVPDQWLDASITPVHKSGSRIQLGNYRPIALMSVVAKLYERII